MPLYWNTVVTVIPARYLIAADVLHNQSLAADSLKMFNNVPKKEYINIKGQSALKTAACFYKDLPLLLPFSSDVSSDEDLPLILSNTEPILLNPVQLDCANLRRDS